MKFLVLGFVLLLGAANTGGGCSNPNAIGVQEYGTITGRVLNASNNRPVANALVSVGSLYTGYSSPDGAFTLSGIPIGEQDVTATGPGFDRTTVQVTVHKALTTDAGYVRLVPVAGGPTAPPPPTAPPATPLPTPIPVLTPEASPAATASPKLP